MSLILITFLHLLYAIGNSAMIYINYTTHKFSDSGTTTNSDEPDEGLMDAVMSSFQANGKAVEVVFSFDTTGSMSQYLHQVSAKLLKEVLYK